MEAVYFSETLASTYKFTRRYNQEGQRIQATRCVCIPLKDIRECQDFIVREFRTFRNDGERRKEQKKVKVASILAASRDPLGERILASGMLLQTHRSVTSSQRREMKSSLQENFYCRSYLCT
jgi:hypothetical protein